MIAAMNLRKTIRKNLQAKTTTILMTSMRRRKRRKSP
jgi:hypothetical protein